MLRIAGTSKDSRIRIPFFLNTAIKSLKNNKKGVVALVGGPTRFDRQQCLDLSLERDPDLDLDERDPEGLPDFSRLRFRVWVRLPELLLFGFALG
jgi:hypothetical protein